MRQKYMPKPQKSKMSKAKKLKMTKRAVLTAIAIFITILIVFPLIWIIPNAFKEKRDLFVLGEISFFPEEWTLDNFIKVFETDVNGATFFGSMLSTFAVALLSTFFSLFVNMFAAYALARINFRGKKFVWPLLLFPMFIPGITIMLTSIRVVNLLSMADTIFVLFVPGLANAYQIFFFRQFYLDIPSNIEEAALIDGSSRIGIFFKIFLPMSITPMIIIGAGTFMGAWNSFVWPTLTVDGAPGLTQMMQIIQTLSVSYAGDYGVVIAATLMSLVVPIIVFAIFQKKIVEGIALTGTK